MASLLQYLLAIYGLMDVRYSHDMEGGRRHIEDTHPARYIKENCSNFLAEAVSPADQRDALG